MNSSTLSLFKNGDIIANLPYHEKCSLWFDHHVTNMIDTPYNGVFKLAPSAAGIIYEYYKESNSDVKEKMKFTEKSIIKALKKDQKHVLDDAFLAYLGLNNTWITFKMFHHDKWTRKLKNMSNIEVPKVIKNNARYVLNELCLIRSGENKKQIAKVLRVTQEKYFNVVRYFCKRLR